MEIKKVLITGGTGFIGRWMQATAPQGYDICSLNHAAYEAGGWQNGAWDYIAHLANISPAAILKQACSQHARVLYASSGAVYHAEPTQYGLNKLEWEADCLLSGANVSIARLFTFCGAWMPNNFAVTNFILDALKGDAIHIMGSGQVVRSYLYAEDMARWLWTILLRGRAGEAYDVGSEMPTTILELAQVIAHEFTPEPEIVVENRIRYEQAPCYLPPDAKKTREELDVRQWTPLDVAIRKTIEAYR